MTRKTVFAVVSVVVALAIATVLWVNRPGPDAPVSSPSPVASSTPTPTPTPDPREVAIAEAEAVYLEYADASWNMAKASGSKDSLDKARPYVVGIEWKTLRADARAMRRQPAEVQGVRQVHLLKAQNIRLDTNPAELTLNVCLDLSNVSVRNSTGEKINASWIKSQVFMMKNDGTWKVNDRDDQILETSCVR